MAFDPITTFETALKINRPAAKLLIGGFLVLAMAAALGNMLKDSGLTFWHIPAALVGFSVLVAILSQLQRTLATLACWTLVILGLIWAVAVTGQIISGNTLPYAKTPCLTGFWKSEVCSATPPVMAPDAVSAAPSTVEAPPPKSVPLAEPSSAATADVDRGSAVVFVQFTGIERNRVIEIAMTLVGRGWILPGADTGGERYDHAAGLNEVRFLHPDDKARAEVLAKELSEAMGGKAVKVLDVSTSAWAKDTPGHLEVWISE